MYETIFFDLDGTLTDSGEGIMNSVEYALNKMNVEVGDRAGLKRFVGPPLSYSFKTFFNMNEEEVAEAIKQYRVYFSETGLYENALYPGILEILQELKAKGKKLVLATSKPEKFALRIVEYFKIDEYFDVVVGASMDESRNTKIAVMDYACELAGIKDDKEKLSKTVMIGDREYDILGAKHFGMDSIGVLYGYGSRQELEAAGATYIVDEISNVINIINEL